MGDYNLLIFQYITLVPKQLSGLKIERAFLRSFRKQLPFYINKLWRKCMGIEPTREGFSPAHRI
jgi:hypothetical protein